MKKRLLDGKVYTFNCNTLKNVLFYVLHLRVICITYIIHIHT